MREVLSKSAIQTLPARPIGVNATAAAHVTSLLTATITLCPLLVGLVVLGLSVGCGTTPDAKPLVGNKPVVTADGLERVEHEQRGTLFIKPDHGISQDHRFVVSQVLLTYEGDSPRFSPTQEQRMLDYVREGLAKSVRANGRDLVSESGPCVLSLGVGVIDVVLHEPNTTGSSTNQLGSWGAVTMVLDIRDSQSGEPLVRYGRRVAIPGGVQHRDARPQWPKVQQTLDALLDSQRLTLREIVPRSENTDPACIALEPTGPTGELRKQTRLLPGS